MQKLRGFLQVMLLCMTLFNLPCAGPISEHSMGATSVLDDKKQACEFEKLSNVQLLELAKDGDIHAQCELAGRYRWGTGGEWDGEKAFKWYEQAAKAGYAKAQYGLGDIYYFEYNDMDNSFRWYKKAAEQGYAPAQYCLSELFYFRGKKYETAIQLCKKAAEQGHARAQMELGQYYHFALSKNIKENPRGKNHSEMLALIGHRGAQKWYKVKYEGKESVPNYIEAVKWYSLAAEQENNDAQFLLGLCLQFGYGVEKDEDRAFEWYMRAADGTYIDEFINVALGYWRGADNQKIKKLYSLFKVAKENHIKIADLVGQPTLLHKACNVHCYCSMDVILHRAVCNDCFSTFNFMELITPENINYQDEHGDTPLHVAVRKHCNSFVGVLYHADHTLMNNAGQNPLHVAAEVNNIDSGLTLLARGANINAQNGHGETPLHIAVQVAVVNGAFIQMLINRGADINAQDAQGRTPLLCAAQLKYAQEVDILMRAKANPNIKDHEGHDANYWLEKNMH